LRPRGEALEFDDTAPLAAIRKPTTEAPAKYGLPKNSTKWHRWLFAG